MSTQAMSHSVPARQNNLLLIKGILAIVWGLAAFFATMIGISHPVLIFSFGLLNLLASLLTFSYININRHLEISHQWLFLEGLIEITAAIVFMVFVNDAPHFTQYMGYGIIFIVFLQFIYGYSLLTNNKLNILNIVSRFTNAIIGTLVSLILIANVWGINGSIRLLGVFSVLFGLMNAHFAIRFRSILLGKTE
ncbi:hypothetical protein ACTHGU_16450 [Chitinophagaceae bacterium MMS25-I14]